MAAPYQTPKTSPKVVIIEDDHDVQLMYKMKLERAGYIVQKADNGQDGLAIIKESQPDIILLDLKMPIMDGAEMLARLRAEDWGSQVRVVILTNISKDEAPQSLRFLHVDRYIVKAHHTPSQVVDIANEILGRFP